MMRHNLGLKLIAFAIAFAAWLFTRVTDPTEEWQMAFDVEVRLGEGTALVSRLPQDHTVTADVTGPRSRLERIQNTNLRVILDARSIPPGQTASVRPRSDRRLSGVSVNFYPPSFDITVDNSARSVFAPEEISEGHLPAGYFIDSRSGVPTEITVVGAGSLVDQVISVVYYLNLSALTGSAALTIEFFAVDENGAEVRNLNLTPSVADVQIGLQPSQALKAVPVVVDYQGTPATNYALTSVSLDPFLVEVAGPAESLAGITSVRTAPINLTGKTSSFEQSVALLPPADDVSLSVGRATVQVVIEQIDTTYTFENLLIEMRGTDPAFDYSLAPDSVDVTIRGGPGRVSQITADLIRPQADLQGLGPGTHSVRVSVALPSGVRNSSVSPSSVTVTVTRRDTPQDETVEDAGNEPADEVTPEEPEGTSATSPPEEG